MVQVRLSIFATFIAASAFAAQPIVTFDSEANDSTGCEIRALDSPAGATEVALMCSQDFDRGTGGTCTAIFKNYGPNACVGKMTNAIGPVTQGVVKGGTANGPIAMSCRAVGLTPLPFADITGIPSLESAMFCEGDGSLAPGERMTFTVQLTPSTFAVSPFRIASSMAFKTSAATLRSVVGGQGNLNLCNLVLSAPGVARSGMPYQISWTPAAQPTSYEIQEASKPDLSDAKTTVTTNTFHEFTNTVTGKPEVFYYRVRATSCRGQNGPYSRIEQVIVLPEQAADSRRFDIVAPQGSTTIAIQHVRFDGLTPNARYSASVDRTYLTVEPASGNVGADGTVTLTVRADPRGLPIGANKGTVTITTAQPKTAGSPVSLADNTKSAPISVTIASPVTQAAKTPPPASTWIVPAVAHKDGIGAQFLSDVKLVNINPSVASTYQLTYTPSNVDGTTSGRQTKIDLAPGQTAALNDVLKNIYGLGTETADATGVLEIRMVGNPATGTVASSRTYSDAGAGTYGQFIPAVEISRVTSSPTEPLLLSHVGQSAASRMNLGLVEALGFATSGHIRAYSTSGQLLRDVPFSLQPFEHQQINSFLARNGIVASSARVEVSVDTAVPGTTAGGVTAYSSQLDNNTHDGSVMAGIKATSLAGKRFVLPGISEGSTTGAHSEVRILNAGAASVTATLTYYPESAGSPVVKNETFAAGELKNFENIVASLFGATSSRGSLVVTTPVDTPLLVTARTFSNASTGGSYGQFQVAVPSTDGIGSADAGLQLLQLEQSDKFRTDVGIAELTGNAADVEIRMIAPDQKASPSTVIPVRANEFMNLANVLTSLGATGNAYNARVTLKVVSGTGRIAAYGSIIDQATNDPTLIPGQK